MPPFKSPFSISFVDASIAAFLTHAERALARRAQKNEVLGAQQSAKQLFHTHRMSLRTVRGSESASKTVLLRFAGVAAALAILQGTTARGCMYFVSRAASDALSRRFSFSARLELFGRFQSRLFSVAADRYLTA